MNKVLLALLVIVLAGCSTEPDEVNTDMDVATVTVTTGELCSEDTFMAIDRAIQSGDSSGHGPDIGSDEWASVVTVRLGLEEDASVPPRGTKEWCQYIQEKLGE